MTENAMDLQKHSNVMSVLGPLQAEELGPVDAHSHIWIEAVPDVEAGSPLLMNKNAIEEELADYVQVGGKTIVDCQPGGCGRNCNVLVELSRKTGVNVIACTGFHRRQYYPPGNWLFQAQSQEVADYFREELHFGMNETLDFKHPVRAGFIKIACEETLEKTPQALLEGAAWAAGKTGAALEIHTEKGVDAENILAYFIQKGVQPRQLVFCHMDKRPDFGLHSELAQSGALMEYDTFFREKYCPEQNLWPLIEKMASNQYESSIALATDLAESKYWVHFGGAPGLAALLKVIIPRLYKMGFSPPIINNLTGLNIARRLVLQA